MTIHAARLAAVLAAFAGAPALAQQPGETAEQNTTPTERIAAPSEAATEPAAAPGEVAQHAKTEPGSETKARRPDADALLRAQAAGYKLTNKDGKEVFCKKEMVTGSRLATRTRCLTLAQIEAERNATKDMLMDMSRKSVNVPVE